MIRDTVEKSALAAAVLGLVVWGGLPLVRHRHFDVPIVKGPGVTAVHRLSEFSPGLKGTLADTNVYVLEGREPGGRPCSSATRIRTSPRACSPSSSSSRMP